ncbi:hypothetical protein BJ944DRAFT_228522 [Cunninghamella echinulata]|nr:hypothetical protein BJ944DRAFT_228522 [Cunninghamella echinulata]
MSPQPTSTRSMPICPSKINSNKIKQTQQQQWHNNNTSSENMPFSPTSPSIARDIIISPSNSTSRLENNDHLLNEDNEGQQQQMQEIFNKRRRRRESHNLVERRRRDNINEKIQELCSLLPPEVIEMHKKNPMSGLPRSQNSLNKGKILQLSVDHIKDLHNQVLQYRQRISELEQILPISQQQQQQQEYSQLHHFNNINPNSSSPMNLVNKDHQFSNFPTKYKYI